MVLDPLVGEKFWHYMMNPVPQMFKNFWLIVCPGGTNSPSIISLPSKKQINIALSYDCDIHTLL
jgi:hypothetical protein